MQGQGTASIEKLSVSPEGSNSGFEEQSESLVQGIDFGGGKPFTKGESVIQEIVKNEMSDPTSPETSVNELQEKKESTIQEIIEGEKKEGHLDLIVKAGVIDRVNSLTDETESLGEDAVAKFKENLDKKIAGAREVFEEPLKEYLDVYKDIKISDLKAALSLLASLIPVLEPATGAETLANKGAIEGVKTAEKANVAMKGTKLGKEVLGKLAMSSEKKGVLLKVLKAIDPTPDIPAWLVAGAAGVGVLVPGVGAVPEAAQLAYNKKKLFDAQARFFHQARGNMQAYRDRVANKVVSRAEGV